MIKPSDSKLPKNSPWKGESISSKLRYLSILQLWIWKEILSKLMHVRDNYNLCKTLRVSSLGKMSRVTTSVYYVNLTRLKKRLQYILLFCTICIIWVKFSLWSRWRLRLHYKGLATSHTLQPVYLNLCRYVL